jgi:hypothetical protein
VQLNSVKVGFYTLGNLLSPIDLMYVYHLMYCCGHRYPETGDVFIPKLKVIGDNSGATYSVNMQKIAGDLNFNVNGVEPTRGCCRFVVPP